MSKKRYLTCAETAKLVRKALSRAFPGQKFYVNSSTYSMGASIDVDWIDGPTTEEVNAVVKAFEGASFDGSIDLKCHWNHWLLPDGSVKLAKGSGTESSRGYIPAAENPEPHPDAELVSLGSDYVQTHRNSSREFLEQVAQALHDRTGWEVPEIQDVNWHVGVKVHPGAAYFVQEWEKKVPGSSDQLLAWAFQKEARSTSAYEAPISEKEVMR